VGDHIDRLGLDDSCGQVAHWSAAAHFSLAHGENAAARMSASGGKADIANRGRYDR